MTPSFQHYQRSEGGPPAETTGYGATVLLRTASVGVVRWEYPYSPLSSGSAPTAHCPLGVSLQPSVCWGIYRARFLLGVRLFLNPSYLLVEPFCLVVPKCFFLWPCLLGVSVPI